MILTRKSHNCAGAAFVQGDSSAGGSKLIEQTLPSSWFLPHCGKLLLLLSHEGHQGTVNSSYKTIVKVNHVVSRYVHASRQGNCTVYGPLASGKYLLVVQCHYSRFPVVEVVSSTSVHVVIPAMDRIRSNFGIPHELTGDNGAPYNSETFKQFALWMGFEHTKKTPYALWANGMAENFMKNLGKVIQTAEEEKLNWRQEVKRLLRAYRAAPHSMTHTSPAALLFNGRKYKTGLPTPSSKTVLAFDDEVRKQDKCAKEKMKTLADQKSYVKPIDIKVGNRVPCRQRKLNKRSRPYASEVLIVIQRKGGSWRVKDNHKTCQIFQEVIS